MKNNLCAFVICTFLILSCSKEVDPFLIGEHHVGFLTDSTKIKDLNTVFANDSVVRFIAGDEFTGSINNIEVFEKNGNKLLILSPIDPLDSLSTIGTVRFIDARYHTEKKITSLSTFKDINDAYKITKIDNLLNSVLISVKELNATFSIDKKELPSNMRFNMDLKIEAVQIPDNAKIKFFMLYW